MLDDHWNIIYHINVYIPDVTKHVPLIFLNFVHKFIPWSYHPSLSLYSIIEVTKANQIKKLTFLEGFSAMNLFKREGEFSTSVTLKGTKVLIGTRTFFGPKNLTIYLQVFQPNGLTKYTCGLELYVIKSTNISRG
jgi:hypothetical protein